MKENDVKVIAGDLDQKEREKSDSLYTPIYIGKSAVWTVGIIAGATILGITIRLLKLFNL